MACSTARSYDDIASLSKSQLINILHIRGLKFSGKSRPELVALAFSAIEMQLPVKMTNDERMTALDENYRQRLVEFDLSLDPRNVDDSDKSVSLDALPAVDVSKIFQFILSKNEFDNNYIGSYKLKKAYSYFDSKFVHSVKTSKIDTDRLLGMPLWELLCNRKSTPAGFFALNWDA